MEHIGLKNIAVPDQTAPKEQSDQGLHCLSFHLPHLDTLLHCETKKFHFRTIMEITFTVPIFTIFTVITLIYRSPGSNLKYCTMHVMFYYF